MHSFSIRLTASTDRYTRQEPIAILDGSDTDDRSIHSGLAATESSLFRVKVKDCWYTDGAKTKLPEISSRAFDVIVDWKDFGRLRGGVMVIVDDEAKPVSDCTREAFNATDVLVMVDLQNELFNTIAACYLEHGVWCTLHGLRSAYDDDLRHTKYHQMLLKSAVEGMASSNHDILAG